MPALVVVGSLNMDFVVSVEHLPAPGETVLGRDFQMVPGGKGANQACAAGKLSVGGVAVRMIGRVGYDVFADHLTASLRQTRVRCWTCETERATQGEVRCTRSDCSPCGSAARSTTSTGCAGGG